MRIRGPRYLGHAVDGVAVGSGVAGGVRLGAGAFAEHVEGARRIASARQGRLDGGAQHELAGQNAYRSGHRRPRHGFAQPTGQAANPSAHVLAGVVAHADHLAGEHQRPSGGVQKQRIRVPQMRGPVAAAQPLGDQRLGGVAVRDAQQRLADAHEGDSLLVGKAEFGEEEIEHRAFVRPLAAASYQIPSRSQYALLLRSGERHFGQAGQHGGSFRQPPGIVDGLPELGLHGRG